MLNADIHGGNMGKYIYIYMVSMCIPRFWWYPMVFHHHIPMTTAPCGFPPGKDISIQPPEGTGLAGTEEVAETMLGLRFPNVSGLFSWFRDV